LIAGTWYVWDATPGKTAPWKIDVLFASRMSTLCEIPESSFWNVMLKALPAGAWSSFVENWMP
jgi:hypothetical protein